MTVQMHVAQGINKRCQRYTDTCRHPRANHAKLCSAGDTLEGRHANQGTERLENVMKFKKARVLHLGSGNTKAQVQAGQRKDWEQS